MRGRFTLALLGLVPFLVLAGAILATIALPFDLAALQLASRIRDERIVWGARAISRIGEPIAVTVITAIATLFLVATSRMRDAAFVVVSVVAAALVNGAAKWVIARPRAIEPAPAYAADFFSFPSGHSMVSAAMFLAIFLVVRDLASPTQTIACGIAFSLVVLAVGTTRVLLGVHYPSDVLGGYLLGSALVVAFDVARIWGRTAPTSL